MKCSKSSRFLGLRPRPRWGSLRRPPDPLVVRGFLPSAIAASRLWRLHYPQFCPISLPQIFAISVGYLYFFQYLFPQVMYRFTPLCMGPLTYFPVIRPLPGMEQNVPRPGQVHSGTMKRSGMNLYRTKHVDFAV